MEDLIIAAPVTVVRLGRRQLTSLPSNAVRAYDGVVDAHTLVLQVRALVAPTRTTTSATLQSDQVVELRDYLNQWLKKNGAGR